MSTTVVYAGAESGEVRNQHATYLTAARGDGTAAGGASTTATVGQQVPSIYFVYQALLTWDTSAVGSDTVSDVAFDVDGHVDSSTTELTLEGYVFDYGATVDSSGDFRDSDAGIPALGSIISSHDTTGGWTLTAGYNQTMGALTAFNAAINGAGETRIVVLSSRHRTEATPTTVEYVIFECTGNTNDARLTITHAPDTSYAVSPTDDVTTSGWATAPLWSKVDEDPGSPDAVVITGTAS